MSIANSRPSELAGPISGQLTGLLSRLAFLLVPGMLGVLAVVPAAASGKAPNATLDESKLQDVIARDLRRGLPDVEVAVTCPVDVPMEKGRKSTCSATLDGQSLTYQVTQTSGRGDVRYKRTKAVIDLNKAQSLVARQVAQQMGGKWKIKCNVAGASRNYVVGVHKTFSCPIRGKDGDGVSREGTIVYKVQSLQGDVDWEAR